MSLGFPVESSAWQLWHSHYSSTVLTCCFCRVVNGALRCREPRTGPLFVVWIGSAEISTQTLLSEHLRIVETQLKKKPSSTRSAT